MNKTLLLSHIKELIFVLKSLIEYNIDFIYSKKSKHTKFLLSTQKTSLNSFNTSICFQRKNFSINATKIQYTQKQ